MAMEKKCRQQNIGGGENHVPFQKMAPMEGILSAKLNPILAQFLTGCVIIFPRFTSLHQFLYVNGPSMYSLSMGITVNQ